jgi:hypothetical protein
MGYISSKKGYVRGLRKLSSPLQHEKRRELRTAARKNASNSFFIQSRLRPLLENIFLEKYS